MSQGTNNSIVFRCRGNSKGVDTDPIALCDRRRMVGIKVEVTVEVDECGSHKRPGQLACVRTPASNAVTPAHRCVVPYTITAVGTIA